MKITCNIIDDLLPLYIDGGCAKESIELIEEHLKECSFCREKLHRMQSDNFESPAEVVDIPQFASFAKKVKRHRLRVGILIFLATIVSALLLSLATLTVIDMRRQASPTIYPVEDGVYNLTREELSTTSEGVNQYVFYTNTEKIGVSVQMQTNQTGAVELFDAKSNSCIQSFNVNGSSAENTFINLSASERYMIVCNNLENATITVSDARNISFFASLGRTMREIFNLFI